MFRKNYREAMNDIKPDPGFVESVIAASKKHRPPLRVRYAKYAAIAAAAVVVVSGTVLSMPLWQRVGQSNDGVISETTVTELPNESVTPPSESSEETARVTSDITPAFEGGTQKHSSASQANTIPSQNNTSEKPVPKTENETVKSEPQQAESDMESGDVAAEGEDSGEAVTMKSVVMAETDEEVKENKMPADMAPYENKAEVYAAKSAVLPEISDADIPAPTGYRCTSATPRGYTFVNDDGAVITVTINYGGEEREPYIEENDDNIYAVFTSYGLSVTINASGAERESVEEIINSLR